MAGISSATILAHEKDMFAEYINDATRYCWDYYPWAEFTVTEKRYYREPWSSNTTYSNGDEVYHKNKYWRLRDDENNTSASPDTQLGIWYEVGDSNPDPAWTENGLYQIGAKVAYEGETYICIAEATGVTKLVNYEWDQITPLDATYWELIDTTFERYIAYEQTGYDTIGTMLSASWKDPRYNEETPANWREGREGIYIEPSETDQPYIWLRFRKDAPTYTSGGTNAEVPSFLAPAIKAYAYKSWLQGEGQHEKATMQDYMVLELLVREVDKLNSQQDRALPYTISSEPYRRINSRGTLQTQVTEEQIGEVKFAKSDFKVSLSLSAEGKQLVKKRSALSRITIESNRVTGSMPVFQSSTHIYIGSMFRVRAQQIVRKGYIFGHYNDTYAMVRISISPIKCEKTNLVDIQTDIAFSADAEGGRTRQGSTTSTTGVQVISQAGQYTKRAIIDSTFLTADTTVRGKQSLLSRNTDSSVTLNNEVSGSSFTKRATVFSQTNISTVTSARNAVMYGNPDSLILASFDGSGRQAVLYGNATTDIGVSSEVVLASWDSSTPWSDLNVNWDDGG